jgi:superfamily I DNA/RNA helicase
MENQFFEKPMASEIVAESELQSMIDESNQLDVCVVGDDDQTIYQWRGSDVQNILTFQARYANVSQVLPEENFRSISPGTATTSQSAIRICMGDFNA